MLPRLFQNCFGLLMLIVEWTMRIDVHIKEAKLVLRKINRRGHRQTRPPRTVVPGQIDPSNVFERHATQQRDAHVCIFVDSDLLFKIQPPFALLWLDSARQPDAYVNKRRRQFGRERGCHMMTTSARRLFVSLLQC